MVLERIKKVIADQMDIDIHNIKPELTFKEDLEIDSLDIFEIILEVEEEFKIEIPTEDLESIYKVVDLENYIKNRIA
ncbi:MAG: acyl carrier protein [Eubacteriales bacterium]